MRQLLFPDSPSQNWSDTRLTSSFGLDRMRAFQFPEDLKLCQAFLALPVPLLALEAGGLPTVGGKHRTQSYMFDKLPLKHDGRLSGASTAEVVGGPHLGKSYPQLEASSHRRFKCISNCSSPKRSEMVSPGLVPTDEW
jgi:hypothetical protein